MHEAKLPCALMPPPHPHTPTLLFWPALTFHFVIFTILVLLVKSEIYFPAMRFVVLFCFNCAGLKLAEPSAWSKRLGLTWWADRAGAMCEYTSVESFSSYLQSHDCAHKLPVNTGNLFLRRTRRGIAYLNIMTSLIREEKRCYFKSLMCSYFSLTCQRHYRAAMSVHKA